MKIHGLELGWELFNGCDPIALKDFKLEKGYAFMITANKKYENGVEVSWAEYWNPRTNALETGADSARHPGEINERLDEDLETKINGIFDLIAERLHLERPITDCQEAQGIIDGVIEEISKPVNSPLEAQLDDARYLEKIQDEDDLLYTGEWGIVRKKREYAAIMQCIAWGPVTIHQYEPEKIGAIQVGHNILTGGHHSFSAVSGKKTAILTYFKKIGFIIKVTGEDITSGTYYLLRPCKTRNPVTEEKAIEIFKDVAADFVTDEDDENIQIEFYGKEDDDEKI